MGRIFFELDPVSGKLVQVDANEVLIGCGFCSLTPGRLVEMVRGIAEVEPCPFCRGTRRLPATHVHARPLAEVRADNEYAERRLPIHVDGLSIAELSLPKEQRDALIESRADYREEVRRRAKGSRLPSLRDHIDKEMLEGVEKFRKNVPV